MTGGGFGGCAVALLAAAAVEAVSAAVTTAFERLGHEPTRFAVVAQVDGAPPARFSPRNPDR